MENVELSRYQYFALKVLLKKGATSKIASMTSLEIYNILNGSLEDKTDAIMERSFYKHLISLKSLNLVADDGNKVGRKKTYYITEKGLKVLKEMGGSKNA